MGDLGRSGLLKIDCMRRVHTPSFGPRLLISVVKKIKKDLTQVVFWVTVFSGIRIFFDFV